MKETCSIEYFLLLLLSNLTSWSFFNAGYPTWQLTVSCCVEVHLTPSTCELGTDCGFVTLQTHTRGSQCALITHSRKDGGVVQVAGICSYNLCVVRVLLFVPHSNLKGQFSVISSDQKGRWAATQVYITVYKHTHIVFESRRFLQPSLFVQQ